MPAFSRALRAQHPNESCASSIYSIPAHEAIDRTSDLSPPQTQQPPAQPRPKAERQPLRIMTRTGKTLCADGVFRNANEESELKPSRTRSIRTRTGKTLCADGAFRNAKGEDELKPSKTRSSDAFSFTYDHKRAEAAQLPKVEQYGTIDIGFEQANVEPAKAEAKQTGCGDGIQQAAVPLHELTAQQVFDEPVVVSKSRYVVAETTSKPPARRPSLVRRLSDSVKDAFRSRSKRRISVPLELQHRPHLNDNVLHPDIKAIPLAEAQKRMAGGQKLSFADHDRLRQQMLNGARAKDHPDHGPAAQKWPSDLRLRNFVPEASAGAPDTRPLQQPTSNSKDQATPTRARSVKVVGHADRATRFSDFMNASVSSNEDLNNYHPGTKLKLPSLPLRDQFSRPELAPQPLDVPNRKPVPSHISYPVADSFYGGYDEAPQLPSTARVTSAHDWRMSEEYPSVNDLFDPIDQIIDAYDIPEAEKKAANCEAHRLNSMLEHPLSTDDSNNNDEDGKPEVIIDTYDRGSHTSWIGTERPDAYTAHSHYRRFEQEQPGNANGGHVRKAHSVSGAATHRAGFF